MKDPHATPTTDTPHDEEENGPAFSAADLDMTRHTDAPGGEA